MLEIALDVFYLVSPDHRHSSQVESKEFIYSQNLQPLLIH